MVAESLTFDSQRPIRGKEVGVHAFHVGATVSTSFYMKETNMHTARSCGQAYIGWPTESITINCIIS